MKDLGLITATINNMAPVLKSVRWQLFHRSADLEFCEEGKSVVLKLRGVHFMSTRQSLVGPEGNELPEGNYVDYFEITDSSPLIQGFVQGDLGLIGDVILYDLAGRAKEAPGFSRPVHVTVNCSDGILDVICEEAILDETAA